jgi:hypothetical protein
VSQLNYHTKTSHTGGGGAAGGSENGEARFPCTIAGCDHVAKTKALLDVRVFK